MKQIYIATENKGKIAEIEDFFKVNKTKADFLGLQSLSEKDRTQYTPEESAPDFSGNAFIKANALYQIVHKPVLAEDAGLVVDALGGRPGVHSARYAPTDKERIEKLLSELKNIPVDKRTARFIAVLCFIDPAGNPNYFTGKCEGTIALTPQGDMGFGYDPVFIHKETNKCFGVMSREEKNTYSHRAKALALFKQYHSQNF